MAHVTVGKLFGHNQDTRKFLKSDDIASNDVYVGVEIEIEGVAEASDSLFMVKESNLLKIKYDDSLRDGGIELIVCNPYDAAPMRGGDIVNALEIYDQFIKDADEEGFEASTSKRTSVHIHVDVRDLTLTQITKFVSLYIIFEPIFYQWLSQKRARNNYCRSVYQHDDIRHAMNLLLSEATVYNFTDIVNSYCKKYHGINLYAASTLGTIEFRAMPGTTSGKRILKWINILLAMRHAALDDSISYNDFPDVASRYGMDHLFDTVFGEWGNPLKPYANTKAILHGVRTLERISNKKHIESSPLEIRKYLTPRKKPIFDEASGLTAFINTYKIEENT